MNWKRLIILAIAILAIVGGIYLGMPKKTTIPSPTSTPTQNASEKAGDLALDYVKNDTTYKFDGMPETLKIKEIAPLDCSDCWKVTIYFESRQAGYGDRTGQILAQVITPHEARIRIENGNITSAIMDNRWDMKTQSMLRLE